jgi:hypothetical protein
MSLICKSSLMHAERRASVPRKSMDHCKKVLSKMNSFGMCVARGLVETLPIFQGL